MLSHLESARENVVPANREHLLHTVPWVTLPSPPQRLSGAMPKLSDAARARLADTPVTASFVIDGDGAVHVPVVPGDTDTEVAQVVLEALRSWRFAPTVQDGRPVAVQAERAFQAAGGVR
ncbi:hypothetical protein EON77_08485 [bacterium]|nr:MAG: hypothetical protein EON77_08485 [bacterium]